MSELTGDLHFLSDECDCRWLAPEVLTHGKFSALSDVWSYGILVYEVGMLSTFLFCLFDV